MLKRRSRILDYAAYLAIRVVGCVLQALPAGCALAVVRGLAGVAYRVDRRHRAVTLSNLRIAFPGRYTEAQLARLGLEVYRHFALMLLEMLLIPRKLRPANWRRTVALPEEPALAAAVASGRPLMFVSGHYGNWEMAAAFVGAYGIRGHMVARPLDNPHLDRMVRLFRERPGHTVLAKHGDLGQIREVLAGGGVLFTLADQDAGPRGLFVDFFGRPASTHKAVAFLARRSGALILMVGMQNTGGLMRNAFRLFDLIRPEEYAGHPDATTAITQRVTAAVERMVRSDPRQYMWLHRRWKSQPPEARREAA